jgi:hypothetical protein
MIIAIVTEKLDNVQLSFKKLSKTEFPQLIKDITPENLQITLYLMVKN